MKLVGRPVLDEFGRQHADVRKQIAAWIGEVEAAEWQTPQDIKTRYVKASFLSDNRVIFNIKGNDYRLDVKVSYKNHIVLIKRIGTHDEYNKWEF